MKRNSIFNLYHYFTNNRLALHIVFWLVFAVFYSFIYGPNYHSFTLKFMHTLLLLPITIVASYFTMFVLIDKLLLKNKYTFFILALVLSSLFFTFVQVCSYYFFIFPILYPKYDLSGLLNLERFLIELLRLYAIVTLATVLKLLRHWSRMKSANIQLSEKNFRAELQIKEIEKQKLQAELDALKSQLNPHFLFNVLNNIYSNSLLKSDTTPFIVLKLSNLMSYILYDCKTEKVSLRKEVEFIKNYIDLEKIRLESDIEITFNINNISQVLIPPLLFIPLVENAFKHGIGSNPTIKYISLTIEIIDDKLIFRLVNSKGIFENKNKNYNKGGIGIENVTKRLALLYPGLHNIRVTDKDDNYEIEIVIFKLIPDYSYIIEN